MSMIIEIQHIPVEGKRLEYSRKAESFPVLKTLSEKGECRFIEPLAIELTVVPERNLIRVDGVIATTIEQACSRCLADFKSELQRRFTLRFAREITAEFPAEGQAEKEIELNADHVGLSFFSGEAIDFTDSVQEQVVLTLPYKPLCSEACKGLCPRCGTDLNAGRCSCAQDRSQNPFAVLKNLSWPSQGQER
ncbi:MAG: DUF177 domain-containing protein [Desulfobacteraceae bacterium]|nr:MAG: DUF177 domain-containing protein [Desulfobacteraceae bacterium]